MARLNIDTGTLGNPATGDTLRTAMTKINTNFEELYQGLLSTDDNGGLLTTTVTNGDMRIQPNGTGIVEIDTLKITDDDITSLNTNGTISITGNGTGGVDIEALSFNGTSISSTDSSRINLNENVTVDGDLVVTGSISGSFTVSTLDADNTTVSNIEVDNFKASAIVLESEGISSNDNDTTLPTSAAVKDYVDSNSVTASETATFTNKTFDADGTGNSITNIDLANLKSDVLDTDLSSVSGADDTIASAKAIKAYVDAQNTAQAITFVGDDSSGTAVNSGETFKIAGATGITTAVSGDTLTITGTAQDFAFSSITGTPTTIAGYGITDAASATATALTVVGDDSSGTAVTLGETFKVAGATGITTAVSGDTLTVTGPDLTSFITASSSDTLTNKTFDVEGTGNSISNIDVADFKAAAIVTEAEGIGSNDNDTTLPTSAAVKDYVDNNAGGSTGDLTITGSTITTPSNADLTLNPGGTGQVVLNQIKSEDSSAIQINDSVNVSGGMTVAGGDLNTADISSSGNIDAVGFTATGSSTFDGVQITDNTITSASSNADLQINASGSGTIVLENLKIGTSGSTVTTILDEDNMSSNSDTALATQQSIKAYVDSEISGVGGASTGDITFTGSTIISPSNADITLDPSGTGGVVAQGPVTFNAGYIEKINSLTSSSTITVDCSAASIHTVTLGTDTEFNISNLPTGGTVTLIITQDGTGGRTATFGTDGSSAVKFPSNSSTLSTGAADIDVVTIINDGTNFLGNIAKDYRSS